MITSIRIDVTKINKAKLFKGKKGTYLDVILLENRDGEDQYGNAGMVVQDSTKEERAAGQRGAILGNYKIVGQTPPAHRETPPTQQAPAAKPKPPADPDLDAPEDDVPF